MSFWTPHQPVVHERLRIARWRVWEVQVPLYDGPSWHLVGYLVEVRRGKVSSALATVHDEPDEVTTKTGKTYLLDGAPGVDGDATFVWNLWRRQHGVRVLREVTTNVLQGQQPRPLRMKLPV